MGVRGEQKNLIFRGNAKNELGTVMGSVAFYAAFGIFQITNFSDSSSGHRVFFLFVFLPLLIALISNSRHKSTIANLVLFSYEVCFVLQKTRNFGRQLCLSCFFFIFFFALANRPSLNWYVLIGVHP